MPAPNQPVDLSALQESVVRNFADGPAGSDWTRLRQSGPSTATPSGSIVTPAPNEFPFRAFVDEGGAKLGLKQPQNDGDKKDGTVALYCCRTQFVNGVDDDIDFTAANEERRVRGDTVRREPTEAELVEDPDMVGELYEIVTATRWRAGGFWALTARLVVGG